jgi:hypothetical protein
MSGGSYFELEWAISECAWVLFEDVGSGLVSRGAVTLTAGTRTTTGHLKALADALTALSGSTGTYTVQPWASAPAGERPVQRWSIVAAGGGVTTWRLTTATGSDRVKLGLPGLSAIASGLVLAPSTWVYGIWAPPLYSFTDDRAYTVNKQSFTTTWTKAPLVIRHTQRTKRKFLFRYVPGRFVRGEVSPNADSVQVQTYGTFEGIWDALSLGQRVYYWPDFDDMSFPSTAFASKLALESSEAAADLSECMDDQAFAEFGRDAHHVQFVALEVS